MLEEQNWIRYSTMIDLEWEQAREEGREVEEWKASCEFAALKSYTEDMEGVAEQLRLKLINAPVKTDFLYREPSGYDEILEATPEKRHAFSRLLTKEELRNKIAGAWLGRISGCLLGKPVEGFKRERLYALLKGTGNYPMASYITEESINQTGQEVKEKINYNMLAAAKRCWADTIGDIAPVDDDTNYTVFALKLLQHYGKDFCPNDVLEGWLSWIPMFATCTAERVAYKNAAAGMLAPQTAWYKNPYREWIGAQIRGDFFGYINPGDCTAAAGMAWKDANISHVKNGIYGEMFAAAMIAAAAVCDEPMTVVEAGLDEIPKNCRMRRDIEKVISWHRSGLREEECIAKIHETYDEMTAYGWCHAISNAMIVVMALLYGGKDFGKTICLAVQAAFDTDCNGATVGSIIGIMLGEKDVPKYWYSYYHKRLATSITGYNEVTTAQLTENTLEVISKL